MCSINTSHVSSFLEPDRTSLQSQLGSALKFRYPPTALESTLSASILDNSSAISTGFLPSCLANGKHGRDKSPCAFSRLGPNALRQKSPSMPSSFRAVCMSGSTNSLSICIFPPQIGYLSTAANPPNPECNCAPSSVSSEMKCTSERAFAARTENSSINDVDSISSK